MNIEEYERYKQRDYKDFARLVAFILTTALKNEGDAFRLWAVQEREKDLIKLKKKLGDRGLLQHQNIEAEIKDLAGCRLVFYSNDDVDKFLNSRIVRDNFDVDWDKSKIHQPVEEINDAAELYRAHHYLVSLKPDRAKLQEYSRFANLKCEIQVQTILNHAWSETGHDVIYKPPKLDGFGTRQHTEIKNRMAKIMKQYLLPAGYEFQKVLYDYERLSQGKELFDRDVLKAIENASDNNARFEILERFRDFVVPNYDDIAGVINEILQICSRAIERARETAIKQVSTPFGNYPGKEHEEITNVVLEIIEFVRYVNPQAIFAKLCDIYLLSSTDKERQKTVEVVRRLAEHNMSVWKQTGPYIQSFLTKEITDFKDKQLKSLQLIVIEACKETLSPEISGTTSSFNTVTFSTRAVDASDELKHARQRAIKILQRLYLLTDNETEKRNLIAAMNNAMRPPMRGNYSDEIHVMILCDAQSIFEFYHSQASNDQYEILQSLEHDALWTYRHTKQWISSNKIGSTAIDAGEKLISLIEQYRDLLNNNQNFIRYKTLVGFDSVFPQSWENDDFEIDGVDEYRAEKISEYVDNITDDKSKAEWFEFIKRCSKTQSNDLATFPTFSQFLRLLSEKKPDIALSYINALNENLASFLPAFLGGLWKSNLRDKAQIVIDSWVKKREHLSAIARHYRNEGLFERETLKNVLEAAIETDNTFSVVEIINICVENHNDKNHTDLINSFLHAINFLTQKMDARWAKSTSFKAKKSTLFTSLDVDQTKTILLNLIHCPKIDYHTEIVLAALAIKQSEAVTQFFGDRLRFERKNDVRDLHKFGYLDRYEAIPYEFHHLPKVLSGIPKLVVGVVRGWYTESSELFTFRGGRFLSNIFESFHETFQNELITLVQTKNLDNIDFVLDILRAYKGETFLHATCKEIIMTILENDLIRINEVEIILQSTDVVTGEFGFSEAYKKKREEIQPWLKDANQAVRNFTKRYIANLDRQIAAEYRRAEQGLELRKRNYGENEG
jgi:ppGpp synthetase/RelA/SpoT-type nucleotidyltranferase